MTLKAMLALAVSAVCLVGCGREPKRPPGVPEGSVPVAFSKNGGWAYCWLDEPAQVNRCRTYNWRGDRLYRAGLEHDDDDVFLRYEGSGPVPQAELQVLPERTQPGYIWLHNGVVLLPRNAFALYRLIVEERMALIRKKAKQGREPGSQPVETGGSAGAGDLLGRDLRTLDMVSGSGSLRLTMRH